MIDKNVHVNATDVKRGYLEIGAQPGDILFMHGSLSSMGTVDGGPQTVFQGMLEACAPFGTIAMPTLWYRGGDMQEKDFDIDNSPAWNGALAENLRQDPRSIRSNHFSHSVSAIGTRAVELTRDHGAWGLRPGQWTDRCFALSSPWTRLVEWNALYTFIGVNTRVCTLKHWLEGEFVLYYMSKFPEEQRQEIRAELHSFEDTSSKPWPSYSLEGIEQELIDAGVMKISRIGCAELRGIRTQPLVEYAKKRIIASPAEFFREPFLNWLAKKGLL